MKKTLLLLFSVTCFSCQQTDQATTQKEVLKTSIEQVTETPKEKTQNTPLVNKKYTFPWLKSYKQENMLLNRIAPPKNYHRVPVENNNFQDWLRHLPLKDGKPDVKLYNGALKGNQSAHFAVFDIDVGKSDLQQCADATMRLRAEYLLNQKKYEDIHFNFTSGDEAAYSKWKAGYRVSINGNKVNWRKTKSPDDSYKAFKSYMTKVYQFAGTASLEKELKAVADINDIQAGDLFIKGGFPGHAVIVMDVVENNTGEKLFLLAQSYMPAQEIHLLKNPSNNALNPWYSVNFADELYTPEWNFSKKSLKRFPTQ